MCISENYTQPVKGQFPLGYGRGVFNLIIPVPFRREKELRSLDHS